MSAAKGGEVKRLYEKKMIGFFDALKSSPKSELQKKDFKGERSKKCDIFVFQKTYLTCKKVRVIVNTNNIF